MERNGFTFLVKEVEARNTIAVLHLRQRVSFDS